MGLLGLVWNGDAFKHTMSRILGKANTIESICFGSRYYRAGDAAGRYHQYIKSGVE
ncbi:hypothetical protein HNR65_003543 [Desulfosalsimonas propionicica]|uniref:Uncharacterized protein n=1 Tax=Desulfosalsimonas propionicica TaxID=332175 RepID=A0A7W0CCF1_9BACT|nr:hypothetical protein [Desulfosalsimonas propionicica]